jgi:long-subunit acyl-CoA synthetase (AMP-forming)
MAIISPSELFIRQLARDFGLSSKSPLHKVCSSEKIREAVCKELREVGMQNGLQGIELIDRVIIAEEQWKPQNGLVANAQKVGRRAVAACFRAEIEEIYEHSRA